MNVFKTLVLLAILQLNIIICCGQIDPSKVPTLNQIIPSSLNAASLGAYGESQVSLLLGRLMLPFLCIIFKPKV